MKNKRTKNRPDVESRAKRTSCAKRLNECQSEGHRDNKMSERDWSRWTMHYSGPAIPYGTRLAGWGCGWAGRERGTNMFFFHEKVAATAGATCQQRRFLTRTTPKRSPT